MKKSALVLFLLAVFASFSYAVPGSDQDGVPDCGRDGICGNNDDEKCQNTQTTDVDQFGCSCAQKTAGNCAALYAGAQCCQVDSNPCTDDCGVINGLATCNAFNNNNPCPNGYCRIGVCNKLPFGWLDIANCEFIRGWALDENTINSLISVNWYINGDSSSGSLLAVMQTNVYRPDVNALYGATGTHGFTSGIPASLRDGIAHSLYFYGIDSQDSSKSALLFGVPKTIRCTGDAALIGLTTFTAYPSTAISAGDEVTLSWATASALSVKILDHNNIPLPSVYGASGSVKARPAVSTTYILTASYPSGDASKSLGVNVV